VAPGIGFSAKTLLEIAVVLLGASLSAAIVWALGPFLLIGIAIVVAIRAREQLRALPRARPAAAHGDPDRVRQLDLRQLGDRRGGADHRRQARTMSRRRSRSPRCSA
jgi:hypothetical protein